jgi:6-phosphofructokinase 2
LVVLSGSQPPGVAKEFPSILADHVTGRGARLIVDTSGPALTQLVREPHESIHVLRMDGPEAEELAGRPLPDRGDTASFASELVERGVATNVIVARGADGSVLSNAQGSWHAVGPKVEVISKVGAGDSFVGAFTLWSARGDAPKDCLRAGVAAAAAAVMTEATRLCDREMTEALIAECAVARI